MPAPGEPRLGGPIAELAFSPDGRIPVAIDGDAAVRIGNAAAAIRPADGGRDDPDRSARPGALPSCHGAQDCSRWRRRRPRHALGPRRPPDDRHRPGASPRGRRSRMVPTPDGRRLITCCDDGSIRCWDVETGGRVGETLQHGTGAGDSSLALSPDGRILISGGEDGMALRWDLATGRRIDPPMRHDSAITAIAFGRDRLSIITGTRDGRLHVWDPGGYASPSCAQGTSVTGLDVSPAGETFAAAAGGVIRLWDLNMLGHPAQTMMRAGPPRGSLSIPEAGSWRPGRTTAPSSSGPCPDRRGDRPFDPAEPPGRGPVLPRRARGSSSAPAVRCRTWDFDHEQDAAPTLGGNRSGPTRPSWAPTAASSRRCTGRTAARRARSSSSMRPPGAPPRNARAARPDPRRGVQPRLAMAPDVERSARRHPPLGCRDLAGSSAHAPGPGHAGATGRIQGRVAGRSWWVVAMARRGCGTSSRTRRSTPVSARSTPLRSPPSPTPPRGESVVAGCQDGSVGMWDLSTGKLLFETRGRSSEVTALTFSPDGQAILAAGRDGTVRFLDAVSGEPLGPPLHHPDAVLVAAFHPDGQSAATGTKSGEVRRWRVPRPPATGSSDEIRRRIEDETGLWLDYQGAIHTLFVRPGLRDQSQQ